MKFKSDIEVQAGLRDGGNDIGTAGQILSSTGSQTNWIDQDSIVALEAKLVFIECKNTSGVTISKGTPVYQTGTVGATDVIEVGVADASDEDKMAAIGLLQTDLANNAFGKVVITGELLNITTSPIDGVTPVTGDTIYVKSGGGLTLTKPTGVNFIQNIGLVGKVSGGNAGSITVSSIMRSNDVPTPLYIDHTNQRLGIGTTSPTDKLDIAGAVRFTSNVSFSSSKAGRIYKASNHGLAMHGVTGTENDLAIFSPTGSLRVVVPTGTNNLVLNRDIGNVGIGTATPDTIMEILGADPILTIRDSDTSTSTANSTLRFAESNANDTLGNYWDIGLSPINLLNFGFNGSTKATIKSDGNVGIGTTNPSAKLEVNGQTVINSTGLTEGFQWFNDTNEIFSLEDTSGAGELLLLSSNSVKVKLNANGTSYFNGGNVGIGTTSPGAKLDINQTQDGQGIIIRSSLVQPEISFVDDGTGDSFSIGHNRAGSRLDIEINGVDTHTFKQNGNVGIGTTNPSTKLEVNGDIGIGRVAGGYTFRETVGGGERASIKSNATNELIFSYGASTEAMRINSSGNVGIGTTSPLNPLSIESSSSPLIKIRCTTNGSGAAIEFNDNGASAASQNGRISYYHADSQSQGGGSSFWLTGEDDQTLVLANNGRVVVQKSGSTTEVGYGFYDDVNTGMYRVSADALGFATGGTRRLDMNNSGVRIGTGSRVTTILDQDNMSSNSNTALATQQSIKAYVDNSVAAIITPAAPSTVTSTIVGETIEIAFNQSTTSDIDYYQVWSSDDGGDYGIIGQITSDDFSATMTVVDTTFVTGGTMSYRVYAVRQGVYSSAATTSKSYTVSALSVTNMTVVNLNTAYYIQYEKPNSRFIDHIEIWMDSQTTQAALNRTNATLVYSGQNHSYMRNVNTSNNFHQFWVEIVTS